MATSRKQQRLVQAQNGQLEQEITHLVNKTLVAIVAMVTSAVWFLVIGLMASGLGYAVHWAETHCTWMFHWMILVGHGVESVMFVMDCVGLLWSIGKHSWQAVK